MISTGYFGIPGKAGGQTHIVKDGKPICGQRVHPDAEFQWCSAGIYMPYVECKRCQERGTNLEQRIAQAETTLRQLKGK